MNKFTKDIDWQDDVAKDDLNDDDEIIWVSKSEMKRDAEALKKLGAELCEIGASALERMPLDEDLRSAIMLARRLEREGRRRQLQLVGKMLRSRDAEPIYNALDKLKNKHNQQTAAFQKLERFRDRLIEEGDSVIEELIELYPAIDRQHLRALVRSAQKEKAANKPPKAYRQIFQYLKEAAQYLD